MPKMEYFGHVTEDGKLKIHYQQNFVEEIKQFSGKKVTILVKNKRKDRSLPQLRYWWGVIVPMVKDGLKEVGYQYSKEQVHQFLKLQYLYTEFPDTNTGEMLRVPRELKDGGDVTTTELMECIAEVQLWASEFLGIYIPDPNEQTEMEL